MKPVLRELEHLEGLEAFAPDSLMILRPVDSKALMLDERGRYRLLFPTQKPIGPPTENLEEPLFVLNQGGDGDGDCIAQHIQASVDVETAHPDSKR